MLQSPLKASDFTRRIQLPWPLDSFLAKQGLVLSCNDDRRQFARLYYRRPILLELKTILPAFIRPSERIETYCCDISRDGIAFLAPCELYPHENVLIEFPDLNIRRWSVVRCRRLATQCFEIGARST